MGPKHGENRGTKVCLKKIETGGFLRKTSEIGIESQQTWYGTIRAD